MNKPLKKMYVCCSEMQKEFFCKKIRQVLGDYVEPVLDYRKADAAYVIGEQDGQMKAELEEIKQRGIPVHEVNENLISQDVYETLVRSSSQDRKPIEERETGR